MANQMPITETVAIEELALSNSFEIAALVSVLEQKGLEVIAEIGRLHGQTNS
ncbi:MAG: hypothetical protein PHI31_07035 [Desulfuromonadaceae bacterium]|nr:hypothetical protein [Desulfuromonadaceae bacterium]